MTDAATAQNGNNESSQDAGNAGNAGADTSKTAANDTAAESAKTDHGIDTSDSLLNDVENVEVVDFSKGMPKDFPKDAWDEEKKAPKTDVLYNKLKDAEARAKGLRDKLAKGDGKAPKDVKEYQFKPSEKSAKIFKDGDVSKDPLVQAAAPIALKYGLSKEAFSGFMGEMSDKIAELAAAQAEAQPVELTPEQKQVARDTEYKKIGANAPQVVKAVESFAKELKANGSFSEADVAAFKSMAWCGENVRVLNILRGLAGGGNTLPMDGNSDGLPSDKEIAGMLDKASTAKDYDEVQRIENKYYPLRAAAGRPEKLQF